MKLGIPMNIAGGLVVVCVVVWGCGDDKKNPVNVPNNTTPSPLTNIVLMPPSPATLQGGEKVNISFDYTGMPAGGGNVYVFPYPPAAWSGSPLYPEGDSSGTAFVFVQAQSVPGHVDSLVFKMSQDNPYNLLYDTTLYVDYDWQ